MKQIKVISKNSADELTASVNEFLSELESESIEIKYSFGEKMIAIVEFIADEEWKSCICADCKFWDDSGKTDSVIGVCYENGQRRRFNCSACSKFKDIRR